MNTIIEGLTQKNIQLEKIIKINSEQMSNMMNKINSLKDEININNDLIDKLRNELETKSLEIDEVRDKLNEYIVKDREYKEHIDKELQNNPNLELHGCFLLHK